MGKTCPSAPETTMTSQNILAVWNNRHHPGLSAAHMHYRWHQMSHQNSCLTACKRLRNLIAEVKITLMISMIFHLFQANDKNYSVHIEIEWTKQWGQQIKVYDFPKGIYPNHFDPDGIISLHPPQSIAVHCFFPTINEFPLTGCIVVAGWFHAPSKTWVNTEPADGLLPEDTKNYYLFQY